MKQLYAWFPTVFEKIFDISMQTFMMKSSKDYRLIRANAEEDNINME